MEWCMHQAVRLGEHLHAIRLTNQAVGFNHHQAPKIILGEPTFQKHAKVAFSVRLKPSRLTSNSYVESNKASSRHQVAGIEPKTV